MQAGADEGRVVCMTAMVLLLDCHIRGVKAVCGQLAHTVRCREEADLNGKALGLAWHLPQLVHGRRWQHGLLLRQEHPRVQHATDGGSLLSRQLLRLLQLRLLLQLQGQQLSRLRLLQLRNSMVGFPTLALVPREQSGKAI